MAFSMPPRPFGSRFHTFRRSFAQDDGLPFASVLTEEHIQAAAAASGLNFACGPNDVYTVAVTLWGFIGQVISGRKCCVAAVGRIRVLLVAMGRRACSAA